MKCPTCKRDGVEPMKVLPKSLAHTLRWLEKTPGACSSSIIIGVGVLGVKTFRSSTAFNNRLERLRKLGLVRRERDGRVWRYYAINQ